MEMIVGYSGFVGSNICLSHEFDEKYDSKNIKEAFGKNPKMLVYSGVPAQKFLANKEPEKDFEVIKDAINNIKNINPKEIVLISTIDVYKNPVNVDEDTNIEEEGLEPYGYDRYYLEKWVKEEFDNYLIVHLPGLYGKNIKKNFIYDLINVIPALLKEEKYIELVKKDAYIKEYYKRQENGFYKLAEIENEEKELLKKYFEKIGFSALNFTDSRGKFQFYNLKYLWKHIEIARKNKLKIMNLATEPVVISEVYKYIKNKEFVNEITENIPNYNFKTKYSTILGGKEGYIFDKEFVLEDIKHFIKVCAR